MKYRLMFGIVNKIVGDSIRTATLKDIGAACYRRQCPVYTNYFGFK